MSFLPPVIASLVSSYLAESVPGVEFSEGAQISRHDYGSAYFETSARTGRGLLSGVEALIRDALRARAVTSNRACCHQ